MLGHVVTHGKPFNRCGVFLGAIDIEAFSPLETFKEGVDVLIDDMKSSRLAPGFDEIMVPGEPEWRELEKRGREGLFLDDEIYGGILETADKLGVDSSKYLGTLGKLDIDHPSYTLKDKYG